MRPVARHLRLDSPAARLGAYSIVLLAALGGGAAIGSVVGTDGDGGQGHDLPAHDGHASTTAAPGDGSGQTSATSGQESADEPSADEPSADEPSGVSISQDSYQLRLDSTTMPADAATTLSFVIEGPDGAPVTAYDVAHEKELHLVVVSRDLATFAHLHPERDAAGRWSVAVPALRAGSYRVYADLVPSGGPDLVLASDLTVPGDHTPAPRASTRTAVVDGFEVQIDGELVPGQTSELAVTVTSDGEPVTDLEPYLGALGHLVAIRDGDLAYLHVHPLAPDAGDTGPTVRFAVAVPTSGTYGLYFDFSVGGVVRTASVVTATGPETGAGTDTGLDDHQHAPDEQHGSTDG
jgi:hypothetical protein